MTKRIFLIIFLYFFSGNFAFAQFFSEGLVVRDVKNNIFWLRCTVGQTWNRDTERCDGDIVKLNHEEITQAITQASEQLGGAWRLPELDELEDLVCKKCLKPKINKKYVKLVESSQALHQTYMSRHPTDNSRHPRDHSRLQIDNSMLQTPGFKS